MQQEKSIGEQRVRTTFNPSESDTVSLIKQKSAELINLVETIRTESSNLENEKRRLVSIAQTSFEEAAMWAVKAATA